MRTEEELRLAVHMFNLLNCDDQVRETAFKENLDDIDSNSEINDYRKMAFAEGLAKGKAQGKVEGKAEGKAEIIKRMMKNGISIEQIYEMLT